MTDERTTPAERLDELTRLYERHAYVAWNVALRTALDDDAATVAARRAFTAQVAFPDEARLPLDAGRHAVEVAGGVDARGIADPLLAATAHLAAVQRAVLALAELTDVPPGEVAANLGIDSERERELRDRAYQQLGLLLGVTGADARAAYADVPWVEPPAELWHTLYPELHAAVTEDAKATAEQAPVAAVSSRRSATRIRGTRRLRSAALAGIAALAVAGVAWATTGGGGDGGDPGASTQAYEALPGSEDDADTRAHDDAEGTARSPLTPEELDRLRREEIEKLKRFERRKDDRRLPEQERDRAARKVSDIVRLARARQRAAEQRELAIRRELAREREARMRERSRREERDDDEQESVSEPSPTQGTDPDDGRQPSGGQKTGGDGGRDRDEVEAECLYDPNNGTYVCPE